MKCPNCQSLNVFVLDSRPQEGMVRRRRGCDSCGTRFSTVEIMADDHAHLVKVKSCVDYLLGKVEGSKSDGGT